MSKYVVVEVKDFNPADHPRDRNGRFIRKGVSVTGPKLGRAGGHGFGKVVGTRSRGRIEVEDRDGKIHVLKADQVEVAKRQVGDQDPKHTSGVPARTSTTVARARAKGDISTHTEIAGEDGGAANNAASERAYQEHTKHIESTVGAALKAGENTDSKYTLDDAGTVWDPDRARQHKEIVDELYLRAKDDKIPRDGKAIIAGGLGGAGKSTVLGKSLGIKPNDYFTINPDDIKEVMAERGMVPKLPGLSPMEASPLVHEESSHIANMLAQRAYADRRNVIWDITMSSQGSVEKRIADLRGKGYTKVDAVFVDIPVEASVERALARHRSGMERYDAGDAHEFGGRYVPPAIIRKNASSKSSSANRDVFDGLKGSFDHWDLFDNSGTAPKKVTDSTTENRELRRQLDESMKRLRAMLADDTGQESTMN